MLSLTLLYISRGQVIKCFIVMKVIVYIVLQQD